MVTTYWIAAGVTFTMVISAFLKDREAKKNETTAWIFIVVATLLWPITLPFILRKKLQTKAQLQLQMRVQQSENPS